MERIEARKLRLRGLMDQERELATLIRDEQRAIAFDEREVREADLASMDVATLREHVADMARDHGADCARFGQVFFHTGGWLLFRRALAELARRAQNPGTHPGTEAAPLTPEPSQGTE